MRGFTLIEFLLVILLLGLLAGGVIPRFSPSPLGVDAAARKIRADLQYARSLAMTRGVNHGINFVATTPYVLYEQSVDTPAVNPMTQSPFSEDLSSFGHSQITNTLRIEFDTWGRPVVGGGGAVTVSNGALSRSITVLSETGYAVMGAP